MVVEVDWSWLEERDPRLHENCCLYAYTDPSSDRILYIGKAGYQSISKRLNGRHKDEVFDFIDRSLGVEDPEILHGELFLEQGRRFSLELLSDVESLLIKRLKPPANVACTVSRIGRPDLKVLCYGDWPNARASFHDR